MMGTPLRLGPRRRHDPGPVALDPGPPRRRRVPAFALAVLGLPLALSAQSDPSALEGRWEGEMVAPPVSLEIAVSLTATGRGLSGSFSLPAEGVRDMPTTSVAVEGDSLIVHITPTRVIRAALRGNAMEGALIMHDQGDRATAVRLFREGSEAWSAFVAERESGREEREATMAAHRPPPLRQAASGPAAGRVDRDALDRLVREATRSHSAALVVLHEGELVGEWYGEGRGDRVEAMSATKSVLSLAVGRLLQLGLLASVDVPVHEFYPAWDREGYREVTIRHLLSHTSGLASPMPTGPIYASPDFVRFALESELTASPGTELVYNNSATNLLAGIIGMAAGQRMDRFIGEALFQPLGIQDFDWSLDEAGNPHGMAGLQIHPRDLARLGDLVRAGGEWEGERLIGEAWIQESLRPASAHSDAVGFLWWLEHDDDGLQAVEARGYLGQYLTILPEKGLVGVRMVEQFPGYEPERDGLPEFRTLLADLLPSPARDDETAPQAQ